MDAWYVYVLFSEGKNDLYKGMTSNLEKRLKEHNDGRVRSTRSKRPLRLVYSERFSSRKEARLREKYFKSGQGRDELKSILKIRLTK